MDINFIKTCKREDFATKHGTKKLKIKTVPTVIETEMQNKHDQKNKIKKQICNIKFQLKSSLTSILYNTLLHQINAAVKSRVKAITTRHLNKLSNLHNKRSTYSKNVNHIIYKKHCL